MHGPGRRRSRLASLAPQGDGGSWSKVMSEEFLNNPLSLFDISGKTAIVTGASGAFGALAAKVLAGAGANVVLAAGNAAEVRKVAAACETLGAKVETIGKRPSSEENCDAIVKA